jgi:hypothetical protein
MTSVYRRSKKGSPVYGKVISGRHLTLPIDGPAKLVVTTKKCSCCGESLALSKFYPESASKGGGLRRMCRECWDETNGRLSAPDQPDDYPQFPEEFWIKSNLGA